MRADTIVWNRTSGEVTAEGGVRAVGPEGDVAYGDKIVLTDALKDGVIDNLLVVLADESRLAAKRGTRKDGIYTLDYAAYTACKVEGPDGCPKKPSWEVKATKVIYDPASKRVKYQGARIELFGMPVIPLAFPVASGRREGWKRLFGSEHWFFPQQRCGDRTILLLANGAEPRLDRINYRIFKCRAVGEGEVPFV